MRSFARLRMTAAVWVVILSGTKNLPENSSVWIMKSYYIYIMTNKYRTTLYVGVTNSLVRRISQHRSGEISGFTKRYNLTLLIYYEQFNDVRDAIKREKQIKGWTRKKKDALIKDKNPEWGDLAVSVLGLGAAPEVGWHKTVG